MVSTNPPPVSRPASPRRPQDKIALWALILGVIAIIIAFIPFGAFVGWIPGITAIVLAIVALARRTSRKAAAIVGLVIAVLGAPISGVSTTAALAGGSAEAAGTNTAAPAVVSSQAPSQAPATPDAPSSAAPASVRVPDVVGLAGNAARDKLEAAGFDVSWTQTVIIASNWKVTAQSSTKAKQGATIRLTVQPKPKPKPTTSTLYAVFKVWGTGDPDVTYSSDSDNIDGRIGKTYKMKVSDDALYYSVMAQLSGGGDIHCSVTINGVTKKGHASGGYNICSAQLNSEPFTTGGWG